MSDKGKQQRKNERGNVFFTLFGAVAVVGVLGAGIMATMRGPLSTMVEVNNRTQAETQMSISSKLAMLEATNQAASGDCDTDNFVEPLEYDANIAALTGGGTLPAGIGGTRIDPWGTEYGYCAWDAGPSDTKCGGTRTTLLDGKGNSDQDYTIIAVISAGPDRTFQSTCADQPTGLTRNGDDLIADFDYATAAVTSGGLWNLKSGAPDTAEIEKDIEVTGGASFSGGIDLTASTAALQLGAASMLFPSEATLGTCSAANHGLLRINTTTSPDSLEVCDFPTGFVSVAAGAEGLKLWQIDGPDGGAGEIYYMSGNVAIGSNDAAEALDVTGNIALSADLDMGGDILLDNTKSIIWGSTATITENSGNVQINGNGGGVEIEAGGGITGIGTAPVANRTLTIAGLTDTNADAGLNVTNNSGTSILFVQSDGNVGIGGEITPDDDLDVDGFIDTNANYQIDDAVVLNSDNTMVDTILVGNAAGANTTGDLNTVVGGSAADSLTSGTHNTIIGAGTGGTLVDGLRNILIGANGGTAIDVPATDTDDYLNIGNTIYGDLASRFVGIGHDPATVNVAGFDDALEVSGDIDATGDIEGVNLTASTRVTTDELYVNDTDDFIPGNCNTGSFHRWDGNSWECETDTAGGSGAGGAQTLDETLTGGNDAEGQDAEDFGSLGADEFCTADLVTCFDPTSVANGDGGKWDDATTSGDIRYMSGDIGIGVSDPLHPVDVSGNVRLSGVLLNAAGAEATPSYTFSGDTNTGLYSAAGDVLGISTGGNEAMRILSNGDVAIGGTSVSTGVGASAQNLLVDVAGPLGATFYCDADGEDCFQPTDLATAGLWTADGANDYIEYDDSLGGVRIGKVTGQPAPLTDWTLDNTNGLVYTSGGVAIGGTTLSSGDQDLELDVTGDIGAANYCDADGANCFTAAGILSGDGGKWQDGVGANEIHYSSGNVGVGTNDPDGLFHVEVADLGQTPDYAGITAENSGATVGLNLLNDTQGIVAFGDAADADVGMVTYDHTTDQLNLTIGGNADVVQFFADGSVTFASGIQFDDGELIFPDGTRINSSNAAGIWTKVGNDIYNENSGNVGIGITNPDDKLDVVGTAQITGATVLGSTLSVTGNISDSDSAVTIADDASITGTLNVDGNISDSDSAVTIADDASITGTLSVTDTVTFISGINMTDDNITDLADPVNAQDAATKAYVDAEIASGEGGLWTRGSDNDVYYNSGTNPYVGIGTTNPNVTLDIRQPAADSTAFRIIDVDSSGFFAIANANSSPSEYSPSIAGYPDGSNNDIFYIRSFIDPAYDDSTTPAIRLEGRQSGSALTTRDILEVRNFGTSLFRITNVGDVGIGTTTPTATLDVDGSVAFTSSTGAFTVAGPTTLSNTLSVTGNISDSDSDVTIADGLTVTGAATLSSTLDVADTVNFASGINLGGNAINFVADPTDAQDAATKAYVDTEIASGVGGLWERGTGDDIYYDSGTEQVGIGTTTPDDTLDVVGTAQITGATVLGSTLQVDGDISDSNSDVTIADGLIVTGNISDSDSAVTIADTLNVEVADSTQTPAYDGISLENGAADVGLSLLNTGDNLGILAFGDAADADVGMITYDHATDQINLTIGGNADVVQFYSDGSVQFASGIIFDSGELVFPDGTRINSSNAAGLWTKVGDDIYNENVGNVGIGTTTPTATLDVDGSVAFTSSTGAFTVAGATTISNTLTVTGNISDSDSAVIIADDASVTGTLNVDGNISDSDSAVTIADDASITGTLNVDGDISDSDSDVTIADGLIVTGNISDSDSDVIINDGASITGTLNVDGNISDSDSAVTIADDASITGTLNVDGNVSDSDSAFTVADDLTVTGATTLSSTLSVTDTVTFTSGINMTDDNITDLADPVNDQDAATKAYVDAVADTGGLWDIGAGDIIYYNSGTPLVAIGATTADDTLDVVGTAQITGATVLGSTLSVAGNISDPDSAVTIADTLNVEVADSTQTPAYDGIALENGAADVGLSLLNTGDNLGILAFGDAADADVGMIAYDHATDQINFTIGGNSNVVQFYDDGSVEFASGIIFNNGELVFPDGTRINSSNAAGIWTKTGNDIYNENSGAVSVGTTTPVTGFQMNVAGATVVQDDTFAIHNSNAPAGDQVWQLFVRDSDGRFTIGYRNDDTPTAGSIDAAPFIVEHGASTNALFVEASGNVGLGNASPQQVLDVSGALLLDNAGSCSTADHLGSIRMNASGDGLEMCDGLGGNWVAIAGGGFKTGGHWTAGAGDIIQYTSGTPLVGIGVATPNDTLDVDGTMQVTGATVLGSTLSVAGDISDPDSAVTIADAASITGTLNVDGNISDSNSAVTIADDASITGTLNVDGNVSDSDSAFTVADDLTVTGATTLSSTLSVTDTVTFTSGINMTNDNITDLADPVNDQDAATKAYVDTAADNGGLWEIGTGDIIYYNSGTPLVAIGATTADDTLDVVGTAQITGATVLGSTLSIAGNISDGDSAVTIADDASITGTLNVDGNISDSDSDVTIADGLIVTGSISDSDSAVTIADTLNVEVADSGQTPAYSGIALENGAADVGLSLLNTGDNLGILAFGDAADADVGMITYDHATDQINFTIGGNANVVQFYEDGSVQFASGIIFDSGELVFPDGTRINSSNAAGIWTKVGNDIYNENTGNVGIGLTNPDDKLDVVGTAQITGATVLGSTLSVTGNISDSDSAVTIADDASITGTLNVDGDISDSDSAVTIADDASITGTLNVDGNISDSDSAVTIADDASITGTLSVTDTVTFTSGINMTDDNITDLADPVNDQDAATKAYVDTVADTGGLWDIGAGDIIYYNSGTPLVAIGATTADDTLDVVGTAQITGATVLGSTLSVAGNLFDPDSALTVNDNLTVTGLASIGGTLSVTGSISDGDSAVTVDDNFAVTGQAAIDGALNVDGNISDSDSAVTIADDASITGTLNVDGNISDSDSDVTIADDLTVTGATTLSSTLAVTDTVTFTSGVNMTNDNITDLADPVNDQDAATKAYVDTAAANGGLWDIGTGDIIYYNSGTPLVAIGATTADDTLDVVGTAQITGATVLGSTLDVTGATTLSSTLRVDGDISDGDSAVTIADDASITGTLTITGDISDSDSAVIINDNASVTGALNVTGDISDANSDVTINDGLIVVGSISDSDSAVTIADDASITGTLNVDGDVSDSDSAFTIADDAEITGTLDMDNGQINNLADPTLDQDAATKIYVDTQIASGDAGKWQDGDVAGDIKYVSGDVGIGVANPIRPLHVADASAPYLRFSDTDAANETEVASFIEWFQGENTTRIGYLGFASDSNKQLSITNETSDGDIILLAGGQSRLIARDDGEVDIGTGSADGALNITNASAANATTGSPFYINNPKATVSMFLGQGTDTSGYTADESSGNIRFAGNSVAWGDIGYYPTGGDDTEKGQFRFSVTGSNIDASPDAKVGVGKLYATTNIGVNNLSPDDALDVVGTAQITGNTVLGGTLSVTDTVTFTSGINMTDDNITDLADPVNDQDAATKAYVDTEVAAAEGLWTRGAGDDIYYSSGDSHVGIGTTNPVQPLHIVSDVPIIRMDDTDSGTSSQHLIWVQTDDMIISADNADTATGSDIRLFTSGTERVRIEDGGDVGIGTTNPDDALDVVGTMQVTGAVVFDSTLDVADTVNFASGINLGSNAINFVADPTDAQDAATKAYVDAAAAAAEGLWTRGTGDIIYYDSGSESVGIGTDTPADDGTGVGGPNGIAKLHIKDSTASKYPKIMIDGPTSGGSGLQFMTDGVSRADMEYSDALNQFYIINRMSSEPIVFHTNNGSVGERVRISGAGNVGIGNTNPDDKLDVVGTAQITGAVQLDSTLSVTDTVTFTSGINMTDDNITDLADPVNAQDAATKAYVDSEVAASEGLWTRGTGDIIYYNSGTPLVGIGTTTPDSDLHIVDGTIHLTVDSGLGSGHDYLKLTSAWGDTDFNIWGGRLGIMGGGFSELYVNGDLMAISTGDIGFGGFNGVRRAGWFSDASNVISQRNQSDLTSGQEYRIYNTYDGTNDEFISMGWINNSNVFGIETEATGTGTVRNIAFLGGDVGIGVTNPNDKLDVDGTAQITGAVTLDSTLDVADTVNFASGINLGSNAINFVADPTDAQDAATKAYVDSEVSSASPWSIGSGDDIYYDSGTPYVGIGTSNPQVTLDITQPTADTNALRILDEDSSGILQLGNANAAAGSYSPTIAAYPDGTNADMLYIRSFIDGALDDNSNPAIRIEGRLAGGALTTRDILEVRNYATSLLRIDADGNVGINNNNPNDKLDVDGTAQITGAVQLDSTLTVTDTVTFTSGINMTDDNITDLADPVNAQDAATKAYVDSEVSSAEGLWTRGTGNIIYYNSGTPLVGIGTDTPSDAFTVSNGGTSQFSVEQVSSGAGTGVGIKFVGTGGQTFPMAVTNSGPLRIESPSNGFLQITSSATGYTSAYKFEADNAGATFSPSFALDLTSGDETGIYLPATNAIGLVTDRTERIRIDADGDVGIGVTNPDHKLDVAGTAQITGAVQLDSTLTVTDTVTFTSGINMTDDNITDLADPVNAQDAATKAYVDSEVSGISLGIDGLSDGAVINSDSIFLGHEGGSAGATDNFNYAFGVGALDALNNSGGDGNVAIGRTVLSNTTSGDNNIGLGDRVLETNTTGGGNVGLGQFVLFANTTGSNNIALGGSSLFDNTTGSANIAIGLSALANNTTGIGNVAIGQSSLSANTTGSANTAILGMGSLTSGTQNITMSGMSSATTANFNVVLGFNSLKGATTATNNTVIGHSAGFGAASATVISNTIIGMGAGYNIDTGANSNVMLGVNAGNTVTSGANNTLLGTNAGDNITTGDSNIVIGKGVDAVSATGDNQLNIGNTIYGNLASDLVGIGVTTPDDTLDVGGTMQVTGAVTFDTTLDMTSGQINNVADPSLAQDAATKNYVDTRELGDFTDVITDYSTLNSENMSWGDNAGDTLTSGTGNLNIGANAGTTLSTGSDNTILGNAAGKILTDSENVFIGYDAGRLSTSANQNVYIGKDASRGATTGDRNVTIGYEVNQDGNSTDSVIIGFRAGFDAGATSDGNQNVYIGRQAGFANDTGAQNVVMGYQAGLADTSGLGNVLLGYRAGDSLDGGNKNIIIGWDTDVVASSDSQTLNIGNAIFGNLVGGNTSGTGTADIGINNPAPDVALDVIGDIEHTGTITDLSDRRMKENITPMTKYGSLLEKIDQIDTYSFTMKDDPKKRVEYGVIAQELEEVFPLLVHTAKDEMGTKSVNYIGLIAPMIEATKELKAENETLKAELAAMKTETAKVHDAVAKLSDQVELLNKAAGQNVGKASLAPQGDNWLFLLLGLLGGVCIVLVTTRRKNS